MSDSFVPFAPAQPASASSQPFRLKVLPQAQHTRPFQPLPQASSSEHATGLHAPTEPKVTLHREGDRVTRIEIRCSCGQCLELDCAY